MKGNCGECDRRWYCEIDPNECNEWPDPVPEAKSNGDRIRAMTDAELAVFLADKYVMESCMRLSDEGYEPTEVQKKAIKHTLYCTWMKWLKQPAKEDE